LLPPHENRRREGVKSPAVLFVCRSLLLVFAVAAAAAAPELPACRLSCIS
jgi:hypothetical protein